MSGFDDRSAQGDGGKDLVSPFYSLDKRPPRKTIQEELQQERGFIARGLSVVDRFFQVRDLRIGANKRLAEGIRDFTDPSFISNFDARGDAQYGGRARAVSVRFTDALLTTGTADETIHFFALFGTGTMLADGDRLEVRVSFEVTAAATGAKNFGISFASGPTSVFLETVTTTAGVVRNVTLLVDIFRTAAADYRVVGQLLHDYLVDAPNEGEPVQAKIAVSSGNLPADWSVGHVLQIRAGHAGGGSAGRITMKSFSLTTYPAP